MDNGQVSESFLYSSIFWGIGVLIVTFTPFILYIKYFLYGETQHYEKKNLFEIIAGTFIIQLFLFMVYWLLATAFNFLINPSSDYLPCAGIREFFFHSLEPCNTMLNVSGKHFWNAWDFIVNENFDPDKDIINATNVGISKVIYFLSILYFFFGFFLVLSVAIIPAIMVMRKSTHKINNKWQITPSLFELIGSFFFESVLFLVLIKAHLAIGSVLVTSIGNVSGFSFWDDITSILKYVLL
jgi:heme/copper-type cytochrome/quinol oxidase subunit 4